MQTEEKHEKRQFSFSFVLLLTSPSALPVPLPHAIHSVFSSSPLSDMLVHPSPPSLLLLFLSGWYIPRTKRMMEGERRQKDAEEREKAGRGVHMQESNFPSFHMCSPLCCPQAQWHFTKSSLKKSCNPSGKHNTNRGFANATKKKGKQLEVQES